MLEESSLKSQPEVRLLAERLPTSKPTSYLVTDAQDSVLLLTLLELSKELAWSEAQLASEAGTEV